MHRHLFSLCGTALCVSWFFFVCKFSIFLTLISVKVDFHVISKYLVSSKEAER